MSSEWALNPKTLPCKYPRVVFRNVTNKSNNRTVVAALIPAETFIVETLPYLYLFDGDEGDQAYILGILSSMILDWYARRFVEGHVTFQLFKSFPIPDADRGTVIRVELEQTAARLATREKGYRGFKEWAKAVGVEEGSVSPDQFDDQLAKLDACVALLYKLDEKDIAFIYKTFHPTADYSRHAKLVVKWFRHLKQTVSN